MDEDICKNPWMCVSCGKQLTLQNVDFEYLGHSFQTKLLRCDGCGFVYVPPDLAMGKMAEVEQLLEDK